jgi:hypothetical protein
MIVMVRQSWWWMCVASRRAVIMLEVYPDGVYGLGCLRFAIMIAFIEGVNGCSGFMY